MVDVVISFNDCDLIQLYIQRGRLKHEEMKVMKSKKSPQQIADEIARIADRVTKLDAKIAAFQVEREAIYFESMPCLD